MKGVTATLVAVLVVATLAATLGEAISCNDIVNTLYPCLSYLTGGGVPSESCCGGVRSVSGSMQSQQDRKTACYCIKSAASSYGVNTGNAASLPGKCGVSIGMTFSPNMDCNQYD